MALVHGRSTELSFSDCLAYLLAQYIKEGSFKLKEGADTARGGAWVGLPRLGDVMAFRIPVSLILLRTVHVSMW